MRITSRQNQKVKALADLQTTKGRREQQLTIAEGFHLFKEALISNITIQTLILSENIEKNEEVKTLINQNHHVIKEIIYLSDDCYNKISSQNSPEGIAVTFQPIQQNINRVFHPNAKILAAAGIQDPGNSGAIVRICEAVGVDGCVFIGGVDIQHPKHIRGAQGSSFRLPTFVLEEHAFLEQIQIHKIPLIASTAQTQNAIPYFNLEDKTSFALLVGAEGRGIPESLLHHAKHRIYIPMNGKVESLNVAAAAGIMLYGIMTPTV